MSDFKTQVVAVAIEPHPNADRLELARIGDYMAIVPKGQFQSGDHAAYIQEASIVPAVLLDAMGLTGRLAGPDANRVKAMRLRGILSQGLVVPARAHWSLGDDVGEELGITKYEPPVPTHMTGEMVGASGYAMRYDIENIKRFPDVLQDGEPVVFTEKIHGTWTQLGVIAAANAHPEFGRLAVTSKGLGSKDLIFLPDAEANATNLYLRVARHVDVLGRLGDRAESTFVLGETFGVQDLKYGADPSRDDTLGFRVFDVYVGTPGSGAYLADAELDAFCAQYGFDRVPVLYRGPYSRDVVREYTSGAESVSGAAMHLREGIVIRPVEERRDLELGRVQLKSVSDDYLLRNGGTEYN